MWKRESLIKKQSLIIMSIINGKILINWIEQVFDKCVGPWFLMEKYYKIKNWTSRATTINGAISPLGNTWWGYLSPHRCKVHCFIFWKLILWFCFKIYRFPAFICVLKTATWIYFQILHIKLWLPKRTYICVFWQKAKHG